MLTFLVAVALGTAFSFGSHYVTSWASEKTRVRSALQLPLGGLVVAGLMAVVGAVFSFDVATWGFVGVTLLVALSDVGDWRIARRLRGLRGEGIVDWDLVRLVEERARREATSGQRRRARKVLELAVALVAQRCPKTSLEVLKLVEVEQLDERLKWKRALTAAEAHLGAGEAASALVELNSVARPLPDARSEAVLRWVDALCLSLLGRYADAEARLAEINGGSARPGQLLMRAHQAVLANDEPKALAELEQVGPALLATWFTEGCVLVQGPAEPLARTVAAR